MIASPKTIQIFLPGGDPRGIRVAEITTRIVQVIEVPRILLQEFLRMPESDQVAIYFLIGEGEEVGSHRVYAGQTGDVRSRLASHNRDKEFWERALVLISRTNSITQTHALFLEWYCLQNIRTAGRYADVNGNNGSKPHTPAPLEADCIEIFETGHVLLATLGYPLFDPVAKPPSPSTNEELFYCNATGVEARGLYTADGFAVLKGSRGRLQMTIDAHGGSYVANQREALIAAGVITTVADSVEFTKDHLFSSPSGAAAALLGRRANGWIEWKSKGGQTLDALKRQSVKA